jgi:uncharacterized membrane protein
MNYTFAQVRKAVTAGITGGIAAFVAAYPDGITTAEIGTIVGAIVVSGLAVFYVKNEDEDGL